ncbi:MAG: hypothetical protein H6962_08405 [Chromatiaceae bacterium]|nr:hypothetical protein [Chromatiaceae bacterium]
MQISRTINHTGRRSIKRTEVEIELGDAGLGVPKFDANFRLETKKPMPADARLYIEAYHKNTSQRFDFGTAGAPVPPESTALTEIDLSGPTLFRVKVVDEEGHIGRLIASAEGLQAKGDDSEEDRRSLMRVRTTDLGSQTWKLEFDANLMPALCLNNRIPSAKEQLFQNPYFQGLVLPSVMREVLMFVFWNTGDEAVEDSWHKAWLDFANHLAPIDAPDPEETDPLQLLDWIDAAVAKFSEQWELCDLLLRKMEEE